MVRPLVALGYFVFRAVAPFIRRIVIVVFRISHCATFRNCRWKPALISAASRHRYQPPRSICDSARNARDVASKRGRRFVVALILGLPERVTPLDCVFRQRLHPGPRHAAVAPVVRGVILSRGIEILSPMRIVLQHRDGADGVRAGREAVDHRPACRPVDLAGLLILVRGPDQAGAHLVPATHRSAAVGSCGARHAGIVGFVERGDLLRQQLVVDPLRDRRAAVFLEGRRIEHAEREFRIALLGFGDAGADRFGRQLQAFAVLAGAIVLAIADERASR